MNVSRMSKQEREQWFKFFTRVEREAKADMKDHAYGYAERICKLSRSHGRLQESACNYGLTPRQESRERNIESEITKLASELGFGVEFSGDPRGYTVKLLLPSGDKNNWGDTGYGVPQ